MSDGDDIACEGGWLGDAVPPVVPWGWYPYQLMCPCQLGPCGHCVAGECSKCAWVRLEMRGIAVKPRRINNYVMDRQGRPARPLTAVRQVGYDCRYVCPCHRQGHLDRHGISTVRQGALW